MKSKIFFATILFPILSLSVFANTNLAELVKSAISSDSAVSNAAIKELRSNGQKGSDALFDAYADQIYQFAEGKTPENWEKIEKALDGVTMQKDSYASWKIFWHTDLEEAKEVSRKTGRPILSLRLLGNLNEKLSCANSRLFRALLYPDSYNQTLLHDKYILHWQTVRPAPKVTVDFGDGRKIVRTLTGNSIHYVLDSDGAVIEALPGLYNSDEFRKFLNQAKEVFNTARKIDLKKRSDYYKRYQESSFNHLVANREKYLRMANLDFAKPEKPSTVGQTARNAAPRAVTKMVITGENLLVNQITDNFAKFERDINLDDWRKLADLRVKNSDISPNSRKFIWRQLANSGADMTDHFERIRKLENFIALDTVRNEFLYRPAIYQLLTKNSRLNLDEINKMIYEQVFLTPGADPWLGLNAPDIYTGLDGNGILR